MRELGLVPIFYVRNVSRFTGAYMALIDPHSSGDIPSKDIGLSARVRRDQVSSAVAIATVNPNRMRRFGGLAPVNAASLAMMSDSSAKSPLRMCRSPQRPISAARSMPVATSRASTSAEPPGGSTGGNLFRKRVEIDSS